MQRTRVILADDHKLILDALKNLIEPEFEVVGTFGDGHALVEGAPELKPQLIVLDVGMPTMNGIEAAERIQQATPGSRVIFLTQNTDSEIMSAALNAGAKGYVLKANAATELLPVIAAALPDRSPV